MSYLYDPKERSFSEVLSAIDRCQIATLRELANSTDGRLILKGGMAMRVAVGSMRFTKDVDFDRADGVSTASVQSSIKRVLQCAAQSAGLPSPGPSDPATAVRHCPIHHDRLFARDAGHQERRTSGSSVGGSRASARY